LICTYPNIKDISLRIADTVTLFKGKLSIFEIDYENIQIESFIFMKLKTIHSDTVFGNSNYGLELRL